MDLEQSFELPIAADAVWHAFADVHMLVSCMPGAELQGEPLKEDAGERIKLLFTVKLGPIVGSFLGEGMIARDDLQRQGSFNGSGADRKSGSRAKGEATFSVHALDVASTRVDIQVNYSLTGPLAQFSRGAIVKELASALTKEFAGRLQTALSSRVVATGAETSVIEQSEAGQSEPRQTVAAHPAPVTLEAGKLFWQVLWRALRQRIRGWLPGAGP